MCQLCDQYVEETISHFLLECPGLEPARDELMSSVLNVMPPAMITSLHSLSARQKTGFLLGEMGHTRVAVWLELHQAIIVFVHGLYKARQEIKDICDN